MSTAWWWLLAIALAVFSLTYRIGDAPIALFDESRVGNNALEMARHGFSLVTTFGGSPDHYNTKPPLLVWLEALSIDILGPNEVALRLPSLLASLGAALLVGWFTARSTGSKAAGFIGVIALLVTETYIISTMGVDVSSHAARSGDFDALLVLWTTIYLIAGYLYLTPGTPRHREARLLAIGASAAALAFMTKSVEGLAFIPALVIYAAMAGQLRWLLASRRTWGAAASLTLVVIGWYVARELLDPGYVAAALANDIIGRAATAVEGHTGGALFYVTGGGALSPGLVLPALVATPVIAVAGPARTKPVMRFLAVAMWLYFLVISAVGTKLPWYTIPLFPLCAISWGVGAGLLLGWLLGRSAGLASTTMRVIGLVAAAALTTGLCALNASRVDAQFGVMMASEGYRYALFMGGPMRDVHGQVILVVYPGIPPGIQYSAVLDFYRGGLEMLGNTVLIQLPDAPIPTGTFDVIACGNTRSTFLAANPAAKAVLEDGDCGLYRR